MPLVFSVGVGCLRSRRFRPIAGRKDHWVAVGFRALSCLAGGGNVEIEGGGLVICYISVTVQAVTR